MKKNFQNAFSLMEMMVVLLIVAIIAAATAPMVTKKMMRNAGSGDSPWVFTGLNNNIAYNMAGSDNTTAIIGATSLPRDWHQHTRLFIDSGNNASHIAFGNGNAVPLLLTADPNSEKGRVGFSNATIPEKSVAFGTSQTLSGSGLVCIGHGAHAEAMDAVSIGNAAGVPTGTEKIGEKAVSIGNISMAGIKSVAIGYNARNVGESSVAIGDNSYISGNHSVAIGGGSKYKGNERIFTMAKDSNSIAIGSGANTAGGSSVAIGYDASATSDHSIAIGANAHAEEDHQIVLGTTNETVYIPGNLIVGGFSAIGTNGNNKVFLNASDGDGNGIVQLGSDGNFLKAVYVCTNDGKGATYKTVKAWFSDRRLKNVGEKYTAGLEELKKLDFYHYTFKADKDNTPLVGVMAQDLQKVFPDAVTKGDDGYLRIRLEDMFYAVINAVKELDSKISEIITNITDIKATIQSQQEIIEGLQKDNSELQKQNAELQEEIKNIEKRIKKLEK